MIKKDDTRLRLKNKFVRNFIYSKLLFIGLMILAQMVFYVLLFVKLTEGGKYMAIASMALSVSFLIYLANSKGKNEFKMAWLVPVIIFPLFGIFLYLICHKNMTQFSILKSPWVMRTKRKHPSRCFKSLEMLHWQLRLLTRLMTM